jgi:hypothetical protein
MGNVNVVIRNAREPEYLYPISDQLSSNSKNDLRILKCASGNLGIVAGNGYVFTWQNPEANAIIIMEVIVTVVTASTAAATLDVDVVANAASNGATIFSAIALNGATTYFSSHTIGGGGNEKPHVCAENGGALDWVTGYESANQATTGLVGKYYIYYTEV